MDVIDEKYQLEENTAIKAMKPFRLQLEKFFKLDTCHCSMGLLFKCTNLTQRFL